MPDTDSATTTTTASAPSFEETLLALQGIVEELEAGNLPLAETVRKFEQGSRLADQARRQLAEAELRITVLTEQMQAEDFAGWDADADDAGDAPF